MAQDKVLRLSGSGREGRRSNRTLFTPLQRSSPTRTYRSAPRRSNSCRRRHPARILSIRCQEKVQTGAAPSVVEATFPDVIPFRQYLRLRDEERELFFKAPLGTRGGTQSESAELQVFLFVHALPGGQAKEQERTVQGVPQAKLSRLLQLGGMWPWLEVIDADGHFTSPQRIPLKLLVVAPIDEAASARGGIVRRKFLMARSSSKSSTTTSSNQPPPGRSLVLPLQSSNAATISIELGAGRYAREADIASTEQAILGALS